MSLCNPLYIQREIERDKKPARKQKRKKSKSEGNSTPSPTAREETQNEDRLPRLHPAFRGYVHPGGVGAF